MNEISMTSLIKQFSADLICFVCNKKSVNPKIMPCCGAIGCEECLSNLINNNGNNNHNKCPLCNKTLNKNDQPVHLHLIDSMIEILPFLSHAFTETNICDEHNKQIEFFCKECQKSLCSECIFDELFSGNPKHQGHHINKTADIINELKEKMKIDIQNIQPVIDSIEANAHSILNFQSKLNQTKNSFLLELHTIFREMLAKVEGNKSKAKQPFEERIHELTDLKNQVITMLNGLEQVLQSDHSGKEKLNIIQDKVAYFQDQFQKIESSPIPQSYMVENEILPPYQYAKIEIPDFKKTQERFALLGDNDQRYMFSTHRLISGNKWRVKIYPNGNQTGVNTHLSIYVELLRGYKEKSSYFYRIEIESHHPKKKNIVKEFLSPFELNDSWGWNKVAPLQTIYEPGYLSEDGTLTVLLGIRAETYYQTYRDLQYSVQYMKTKIKNLSKNVK